ncbi:hypothetical protein JCGZ_06850 [Jatropha curcas]|uniref:Uncharacterized protein n=1 Tax=Jatropha curcas TaxID=180498 RepID=A0A067L0X3_JATCU|nr:hypothetical protein JCGZ_06850 [Jatropha curcas]
MPAWAKRACPPCLAGWTALEGGQARPVRAGTSTRAFFFAPEAFSGVLDLQKIFRDQFCDPRNFSDVSSTILAYFQRTSKMVFGPAGLFAVRENRLFEPQNLSIHRLYHECHNGFSFYLDTWQRSRK